jgi:hypothetical protein
VGTGGGGGRHACGPGQSDNRLVAERSVSGSPPVASLVPTARWGGVDERDRPGLGLGGHRLAQTVAYGDLGGENPAIITSTYEKQADSAIEIDLEGRVRG